MKKNILLIVLFFTGFTYGQTDVKLAKNYIEEGAFEKASTIYKKLYDETPFNIDYLKKLVYCYQETNRFEIAEELLKSRIKEIPSQTYLYVILGNNYQRQQQTEIANKYFKKALDAININQNYGGIIAGLFKEYTLLEYAIDAYKKTMQLNPNLNYTFQIAQIYGEKGMYDKMFQAYIDILDKYPKHINFVKRYTNKYITDDSENEYNIVFRKTLLRKSVNNPKDIWNGLLSWLFLKQKQYNKAFIQEKALYQRNKEDLDAIFSVAVIAFDNGSFDTAKQSLDFVITNTDVLSQKIAANTYLAKIAVKTNNLS